MSLSNSGIKEMSSSNVGKSFAGGKEPYSFQQGGGAIELKAPVITFSDIKQDTQKYCVALAEEAFRKSRKGELKYFKEMAQFIKLAMDEKFGGSWHVIVGRNFGSYMTYEDQSVTMFWINHIGFLIFKFG